LIRHISFSTHENSDNIKYIIDTAGIFASVLCQYNLLNQASEEALAHAHEKGLGTVIMGPVGGGRLGVPSKAIQSLVPGGVKTTAEIALRFVLTNPNVSCALSGMSSIQMLDENVETASNPNLLSQEEIKLINEAMEENRRLSELYCTGCNYCMPCPAEVNIPLNFSLMNYHRVYNLTDYAKDEYSKIGTVDWMPGKPAHECLECGACEPKCPQKIEIRRQLKETATALSS
jgi:predicted aldo/keto reductase-like oxidoreductase